MLLQVTVPLPPPSPYSNIKRIKLIVRRPPPSYSNPNQLPPPPKHGSSISAFLSSYTTMEHKDVSARIVRESVRRDAGILERASKLKEEGRWFYRSEEEGGIIEDLETPQGPERTTKDVWDHCIEEIVALGQAEIKRPIGAQIASQIASKVQAYWEGQHAKQDKKRVQEEKRLRVLAKQTIKEVTSAWGKIVLHIRHQEQVEREAEELKRGHEHLDAILDQSGLLLETQHNSLVRRSRSTSSDGFGIWGSEGGDSDDSEGDGEGGEEDDIESDEEEPEPEPEQSDGGEEGDDDMDVDTIVLLGGNPDTPISQSVEASPTASTSILPSRGSVSPDDAMNDESLMLALEDLLILPESSPPPTPTPSSYPLGSPSLPSLPNMQAKDASPVNDSVAPSDYAETVPSSVSAVASPGKYDEDVAAQNLTTLKDVRSQIPNPDIDLRSRPEGTIDTLDEVSAQSALEEEMEVNRVHPFANDINKQELPKLPVIPEDGDDTRPDEPEEEEQELPDLLIIPEYLKPFAVAPVEWDPDAPIKPPLLLRGVLRPYQQTGLEWLTTLHRNNLNGILADEMGLGKTIQTISLLAHLACDRGIWGPHLIIVPTSVLLNWEMEFKKFLPGFRVLSYHGTTKRRKELRQGWNDKYHFNVCITSYTLASRDAHIFKRRAWYYMILDEAHMIKNFKSQRWNILLMFRSFRRLLLTGTPLQNNLTELWALLQFLMSGSNFANLKEFGDWFSNPLEKAIEMGNAHDDETMQRVSKLHTVLRPYLLRRLKRDVEKELPSKFEHLMLCPLSKRQRYLYDEFMSRAHTQDALQSGVYQKIANILMQLRKVCNHPDLFEVRPVVTSFAMTRSAVADFEIKELLIRRRLLTEEEESLNLDFLGLRFIDQQNTSEFGAMETRRLDATSRLPFIFELPGEPPPKDMRTIDGFRAYAAWRSRADKIAHWTHVAYVNRYRIQTYPSASHEMIAYVGSINKPILPLSYVNQTAYLDTMITMHTMVKTYAQRSDEMASTIDRFAFATPPVVALDIPRIALPSLPINQITRDFDAVLHKSSVKLQIAFPDPLLLQYDCGKLQQLNLLLREKKAGGHRVLIFTQMTRILDILEIFLNFHGYLYLRLDGATKIEDRQYITERFNADSRIFCFIASSRSGGVGINLTGADTVVFYDSDFNPQMDRQCEDRAHRIGQIRDVHIYRFVSQYTVEEAMLRKANQKRSLDDLVIQKGGFDWRTIFNDEKALTNALEEFDDQEDAHAAAVATREEVAIVGADEADFGEGETTRDIDNRESSQVEVEQQPEEGQDGQDEEEEEEEGGTIADYMLAFVKQDYDYFKEWRV
ncbi:SNF2 family N-terminal domain-containing protein [Armillaria nabsnona]|nr:SNF2 family N-terminal domain-containing protein [Armillaria nabsnona]